MKNEDYGNPQLAELLVWSFGLERDFTIYSFSLGPANEVRFNCSSACQQIYSYKGSPYYEHYLYLSAVAADSV